MVVVDVQISDAMLHPQTASALHHNLKVPWTTFRKTFPLYMSISLVPYVVSLSLPPHSCCTICAFYPSNTEYTNTEYIIYTIPQVYCSLHQPLPVRHLLVGSPNQSPLPSLLRPTPLGPASYF